jgi:hypothetical protein
MIFILIPAWVVSRETTAKQIAYTLRGTEKNDLEIFLSRFNTGFTLKSNAIPKAYESSDKLSLIKYLCQLSDKFQLPEQEK